MTDMVEDAVENDDPGFHLFAKLGLAIESLSDQIKKANQNEQRRLEALPRNIPFQALSAPGAGTTDIKDLGGPQPGRIWQVRLLSAFADPVAANAATVSWYIGQVMPGSAAGQLPLSMKRWEFTSLPGEQTFNSTALPIRNGEHLIAGLTAVPASSRIFLSGTVDDQPIWAARYAVASE